MANWKDLLGEKLQENVTIAPFTTLMIGGSVKGLVSVTNQDETISILTKAINNSIPYLVIGGGSNLLVSDEGVDMLIIRNKVIGINIQGDSLVANSGTLLQDLVDSSIKNGLSGLQKLIGIPGTVGGAIYGNAGAYGQSISDHLTFVTIFDPQTLAIQTLSKDQCGFNYRHSSFKLDGKIILEATFQFELGNVSALKKESQDILEQRIRKYPPLIKCPGSFFKNIIASTLPPDVLANIPSKAVTYDKITAGYLLEAVEVKGVKRGGIEVAPYHANLFINTGEGTARDFCQLASECAQKVYQKFNIKLEPEVQLINLPPIKYS